MISPHPIKLALFVAHHVWFMGNVYAAKAYESITDKPLSEARVERLFKMLDTDAELKRIAKTGHDWPFD